MWIKKVFSVVSGLLPWLWKLVRMALGRVIGRAGANSGYRDSDRVRRARHGSIAGGYERGRADERLAVRGAECVGRLRDGIGELEGIKGQRDGTLDWLEGCLKRCRDGFRPV